MQLVSYLYLFPDKIKVGYLLPQIYRQNKFDYLLIMYMPLPT